MEFYPQNTISQIITVPIYDIYRKSLAWLKFSSCDILDSVTDASFDLSFEKSVTKAHIDCQK